MKIHRFIGQYDTGGSSITISDSAVLHQLARVLRLHTGEEIILGDGRRNETRARIAFLSRERAELAVVERRKNENEPACRATLFASVIKRENFELMAEKAVESGISEIIPLLSSRTLKMNLSEKRIHSVLKEAAEQSGRGIIPTFFPPIKLADAFAHAKQFDASYFFDSSGVPVSALMGTLTPSTAGIFIGPEGGWNDTERSAARANGCHIISLGPLTLRAETAGIIASYIVTHPVN